MSADEQLRVRLTVERAGTGTDELPFVIGVIGDFVPATDRPLPDLIERAFLTVTPRNFDTVLDGLRPRIDLADLPDHLTGGPPSAVSLTIRALADFTPERLVLHLPGCRDRLSLRTSLAALKRDLWRVPADGALRAEAAAQLAGLLDPASAIPVAERCRGLRALASSIPADARASWAAEIDGHLADIDARLAAQMDAVLHHPAFQAVERIWRSLDYLVRTIAAEAERQSSELVKIRILPLGRDELFHELAQSCVRENGQIIDIDRRISNLYEHLYTREYGQHGGEPYALMVLDVAFDANRADAGMISDTEALRVLSLIGQAAHLPILAAAAPGLIGRADMAELGREPSDLAASFARDSRAMLHWRGLRHQEASRYLALALPDCLLRAPLRANPARAWQFPYDERATHPAEYLWMPAAFPLAGRIACAALRHGWGVAFLGRANNGAGRVDDLPLPAGDPDSVGLACAPLRVHLTESQEQDLRAAGLIPLMPEHLQPAAAFFSAFSLYQPKMLREPPERIADPAEAMGDRLSAQLPFIMAVSRVAHCLKVMMREQVGAGMSRMEIESTLNRWLAQFVSFQDDAAPATRARRPLREAGVSLREIPGEAGQFDAAMVLKPHFQIEELDFNLNLTTRLRVGGA